MHIQDVILVNESDEAIGTMEKMEAHRQGLLHRAFSVFIFNNKGEMLLQQRADHKYHSAGLWTNACCSHPFPGEDILTASSRRLKEELGFTVPLDNIFSFIYKTAFENGLTEHEFDHVLTGIYDGEINPEAQEVKDVAYKSVERIEEELKNEPLKYTTWFLIAFPRIKIWLDKQGEKTKNLQNC
jgi:isopentenyl-diphosphate delta-isomerase